MTPEDFLGADRANLFGLDPNTVPQQMIGITDTHPAPSQWVQHPNPPAQIIAAASDVLVPYVLVSATPNVSAITLTSQPTMAAGWMGQVLVIGNFGAYNLTIKNGAGTYGFRLSGAADLTLAPSEFAQFMYITNNGWCQIAAKVQL